MASGTIRRPLEPMDDSTWWEIPFDDRLEGELQPCRARRR